MTNNYTEEIRLQEEKVRSEGQELTRLYQLRAETNCPHTVGKRVTDTRTRKEYQISSIRPLPYGSYWKLRGHLIKANGDVSTIESELWRIRE